MKIKNQVCSLEQAKKIKELGINQDSIFFWDTIAGGMYGITYHTDEISDNCYAAFTVAELGVMLPGDLYIPFKGISGKKRKYPQHLHCFKGMKFCINYTGGSSREFLTQQGNTEAEARASMLIYLLENNLTTPEEVNQRLTN